MKIKSEEAKSANNPLDPIEGAKSLFKIIEMAWRHAGFEPDQPLKTHDDMMLVVDFFESMGMKMNGGTWILSKGYCDPTEELGGRVYGTNGCCTAKEYAQKMGGYFKYVQPIVDSQIKFDALVEKTGDIVRAKGATSLQDLNKAMVITG